MSMDKQTKTEPKMKYFGSFSRIALIFFIGFTVFLTFSTLMLIFLTRESKEIKVPDVVGKPFISVYNSMTRKGIQPEIKFHEVHDIENGLILSQHPEAGNIIKANSTLTLVVSKSMVRVEVPGLIGTDLPMAINKLKNLHSQGKSVSISPGIVTYIPSSEKRENVILAQSPAQGVRIMPDQKVNFLVSSGENGAKMRMPKLNGQSIDLSFDLLLSKGVQVRLELVETRNPKKSGTIISHTPFRGARLKAGQTVSLKVFYYPLKDHPYNAYEKVEFVLPEDAGTGLYEAHIEDDFSRRIRFAQKMKPGSKVRFIFYRHGNAKITILNDKKKIRVIGIDVDSYE